MLQDGANLLDGDAVEPLNELRYERAVFEVLEERRHRDSGAAKYPDTAHSLVIAFNRRTSGPIDHNRNLAAQRLSRAAYRCLCGASPSFVLHEANLHLVPKGLCILLQGGD